MDVVQLWRYPVKSVAGEELQQAEIGPLGIDGDRQWGLVDAATGLVLTARRVPDLLFAAAVHRGDTVALRLPDGTVTADDAVVSEWLGRPVRLRRPDPDERGCYEIAQNDDRPEGDWTRWHGPEGVWHDSASTRVSIITDAALGDWDVRRFRPNIVVGGVDERDLLDHDVTIGDVRLRVTKEIDRCVMVTRPQPGIDRDKSVLRRVHEDRGGRMGVGALLLDPGVVRVGDPATAVAVS